MYQRVKFSLMALFFIVLLLGIANAAPVTVVSPATGDELTSGKVWNVKISIDYGALLYKPAKYRLSYWCRGDDPGDWKTMTVRYCSTTTGCYPTYLWEVPCVQTVDLARRKCKVKAELYQTTDTFTPFAKDVSDLFKILPYEPIPIP